MHRILGIVAEYNPFHLGHHHQLNSAKAETGCDYTVIAMSGNFVQRGEPAVFNKWIRGKMALAAGADLVLEIPTWFVLQSAEGFARAGVALLSCCGTTHLSFGSETGSTSSLIRLAEWLDLSSTQHRIRTILQEGITYAAAVQRAAESTEKVSGLAPVLTGANDILAIEYIRALHRFAPDIILHPIKRIGHHNSRELGYASATELRQMLAAGKTAQAREYVPQPVRHIFDEALKDKAVFTQSFAQALFYALLTMKTKELRTLPACSEGLENRIKKALAEHRDVNNLIGLIKTKRYPRTRIQRLLMQALLQFNTVGYGGNYAPYLRILACSDRGKKLLSAASKLNRAPVIFSARDIKHLSREALALLELDQRAANVYSLAQDPGNFQRDIVMTPVD